MQMFATPSLSSLPKIVQRKAPSRMDSKTNMRRRVTFDPAQLSRSASSALIAEGRTETMTRSLSKGDTTVRTPLGSSRNGSKQGPRTLLPLTPNGAGGSRRLSDIESPTSLSLRTPEQEQEDAEKRKQSQQDAVRAAWIKKLGQQFRLDTPELNHILKQFDKANNKEKTMDFNDFNKALCGIFDKTEVKESVVDSAWTAMTNQPATITSRQPVDVEAFLSWYQVNMFTEVAALTASADSAASEQAMIVLARKHCVSSYVMDKVKRRFNEVDLDHSGLIDYKEFQAMMRKILRARSAADISQDRMMRFWQEIDADGSGEVDFSEFTEWYLKYFDPDNEGMTDPIDAFYASFNPDQQRRSSLESGVSLSEH